MLNPIRSFALVSVAAAALSAQPQVTGVGNFTHVVENLDRSLAFYRDALGLEVANLRAEFSANPAIMKMAGTSGGESRLAALKIPGTDLGVELLEYRKIDRKPARPRFYDPGAANLIVRVKDIDATLERVKKAGAHVISAAGGVVSINATAKVVFVQDPDGFVMEIAQADAKSAANATTNVVGGAFEVSIGDTDETVAFYKNVLGPQLTAGASFNTNKLMAETAGAPGARFRQSRSNIPGTQVMMTFIEFKDIDGKPLHTRTQDPGTAILQLRVNDVDGMTKMLKNAGATVVSEGGGPVEVAPGRKIALLRDLNNLYLELLSPPPAK